MNVVGATEVVEPGSSVTRICLGDVMKLAAGGEFDIFMVDAFESISTNGKTCILYCDRLLRFGVRVIALREQVELIRSTPHK